MITRIRGKLVALTEEAASLEVGEAFEYEVLVAEFARRRLQGRLGETVALHTLHYLEGDPARGKVVPRLVGFLSEAEREFFELICSVDGLGVKKALRAMVRPVQEVARQIEEQDVKSLAALPGIGPATSERIVAKLRRKMPRFALLVTPEVQSAEVAAPDVVGDAFSALCALGHSESDARRLIDGALATKQKFKDVESLIQAIYQQSR